MSRYVEPVRNREDVQKLWQYLLEYDRRYAMIWKFGCNTILRISDILALKYEDIIYKGQIVEMIFLREGKTGKAKTVYFNSGLVQALSDYVESENIQPKEFLFYHSPHHRKEAIDRRSAWRVIKRAANKCGLEGNIGTHSMRKSLAYAIYEIDHDIAKVMIMLNHSSPKTTLSYLGITQNQIAETYRTVQL